MKVNPHLVEWRLNAKHPPCSECASSRRDCTYVEETGGLACEKGENLDMFFPHLTFIKEMMAAGYHVQPQIFMPKRPDLI